MEQIDITLNGQSPIRFRSWEQLSRFVDSEWAEWSWLAQSLHNCAFANAGNTVSQQFSSLRELINSRANGRPIAHAESVLLSAYQQGGPLFFSESREGETIRKARSLAGDRAGAFAYAVYVGSAQLGHASTRADVLGIALATFPELGPVQLLADRLAAERTNYKSALNRQIEALKDQIEAHELERERLLSRAYSGSKRMFRRRIRL